MLIAWLELQRVATGSKLTLYRCDLLKLNGGKLPKIKTIGDVFDWTELNFPGYQVKKYYD